MGRLRKAKVDMIIKLRKQGYTQTETAEKVGVHLKTVQSYDPLRRPKKAADTGAASRISIEDIEYHLRFVGDWIDAIYITLMENFDLNMRCPKCDVGELDYVFGKEIHVCNNCGHEMPYPGEIWDSWQDRK